MDRLDSSGSELDLDIDLESGETSEEDANKVHSLSYEESIRSGFVSLDSSPYGSVSGRDCSSSEEKSFNSDEISAMQSGNFREEILNMKMDRDKSKKHNSKRAPKPPRPPKGPLLDASDMKLLKEISELNLKRKRMERIRTLKNRKKEKPSSLNRNLLPLLVTVIFFLVIIFQGLLGSRV
ncbi:hypothetical protein ACJIZ3_015892 [Penstemon smallii]|uniref:Transmembrane protein n=1 Tax=Penstemon smallii TaxID=265156 RepID=A0ABD3RNU3_9LAMI